MKSTMRFRVVLVLAALALVAGLAWTSRPRLQAWTRAQLAQRLLSEVAAQPEDRAVRLVRELDRDDPEWLVVFVAAFADQRPAVAAAGQDAIVDAVERWQRLSPEGNSLRVAVLARLLADQAPRLTLERLVVAQGLAHQLLAWPIDGRHANAARLIADCETILSLPRPELEEIRLAAMPPSVAVEAGGGRESIAEDSSIVEADDRNRLPTPLPVAASEPMPPVEAVHESPAEPRRLALPKAMRISDD